MCFKGLVVDLRRDGVRIPLWQEYASFNLFAHMKSGVDDETNPSGSYNPCIVGDMVLDLLSGC